MRRATKLNTAIRRCDHVQYMVHLEQRLREARAKRWLRPHNGLGMSRVGHPCDRKLYFFANDIEPYEDSSIDFRTRRLWSRGDIEEFRIFALLDTVGVEVAPHIIIESGDERFASEADGIVRNVPGHARDEAFLLEIKTANKRNYGLFYRYGIAQVNPQYFSQVQCLMHFAIDMGYEIRNCLYTVTNKDTDGIHTEIIPYDASVGMQIEERVREILSLEKKPPKIHKLGVNVEPCDRCEYWSTCW